MKEIYKRILNGNFAVSNYAHIKVLNSNCRYEFIYNKEVDSYITVKFFIGDKYILHALHRLIAKLFVENPNPKKFNVVNHKDENKQNNCALNLEWCDHKYNSNYGTIKQKIGKANREKESNSFPVICTSKDQKIRVHSLRMAEEITGVSRSIIEFSIEQPQCYDYYINGWHFSYAKKDSKSHSSKIHENHGKLAESYRMSKQEAQQKLYDKKLMFKIVDDNYFSTHKPCKILCPRCHKVSIVTLNHIFSRNKNYCTICGKKLGHEHLKISPQKIIDTIHSKFPEIKILNENLDDVKLSDMCKYKCLNCGYIKQQRFSALWRSKNKRGCARCNRSIAATKRMLKRYPKR